jgi:hypothetical protein
MSRSFIKKTERYEPKPKPSHLSLVKNNLDDKHNVPDYNSLKHGVPLAGNEQYKDRFESIACEARVAEKNLASFVYDATKLLESYVQRDLPEWPKREFRRGEDDVIEYIRASDGLGPWAEANALNRPLMRKIAPGAYNALLDFLRRNELPADLNIPKKSEVLASEPVDLSPEAIKAARRLLSRIQRERQGGQGMSR